MRGENGNETAYLRQTSSQKIDESVGFWKARSKKEKLST